MTREYIIIYVIYALGVYLFSILSNNIVLKLRQVQLLIFIFIFLNSLIAAFRPEYTQDTEIYNAVYQGSLEYILSTKITRLFANRSFYNVEVFYVIIMACFRSVFKSPVAFYFVQGLASNILMMYALFSMCEYVFQLDTKMKRKDFFTTKGLQLYSAYLLMVGILFTSSAIRVGLSVALGFWGVSNMMLNRRNITSIILLVLSIWIHTTSIVFVPIVIFLKIWKHRLSAKWLYLFAIILPIMYLIGVGRYSVEILAKLVIHILESFNIQAFYSYVRNLEFIIPMREGWILVLTCILMCLTYAKNKNLHKYLYVVLIGLFMLVLAYPIPAIARLLYIFVIFLLPVLMEKTRYSRLSQVLTILYFVPQYVYVFGYL